MSLKSGESALEELVARLGPEPRSAGVYPAALVTDGQPMGTADLPTGIRSELVEDWLWTSTEVPPLRDPAAYRWGDPALLSQSVATALAPDSTQRVDQRRTYCRGSADVTMCGGTTSGVIYPLAICEIARGFRLRNIGGASAGAIAAAAAAAAEVGRAAADDDGTPLRETLTEAQISDGRVRPGFPGLADCMAWLAQCDAPGDELFRVAQLFRPTARARPLFRLVVAGMRGRVWKVPPLLAGVLGSLAKALIAFALIFAVAVVARIGPRHDGVLVQLDSPWAWLAHLAASLCGLAGLSLSVAAVALLLMARSSPSPERAELVEPVSARPAVEPNVAGPLRLLLLGLVLALVAPLAGLSWLSLLGMWALLVLVVGALIGVTLVGQLGTAKQSGFGLVSGSAAAWKPGRWDRFAGLPKPTVDRPLVDWLSGTLNELAALEPGEVLRFGHLWMGRQYQPGSSSPEVRDAAREARRRRVNLELVSSELVQNRSYRFPLPSNEDLQSREGSQLYFREDDLGTPGRAVFPEAVMEALLAGGPAVLASDVRSGEEIRLYPVPQPWDLPVIFAVRLSLSLPALFEAVRLYRLVEKATVRDDFGRALHKDGEPITFPGGTGTRWAAELWFSDGGITSNFPIHFFDSPLPLWPTFGINLGSHPPGFAAQDVWLPQDWQGASYPAMFMGKAMTSFLMAIIDTARGWRDTEQTFMPGLRGRVAWVRQRPDEGGANLFMGNETIAGLALRGSLAGARLRRRFLSEPHWQRHQWLRLRSSMGNLSELVRNVEQSAPDPVYASMFALGSGPATLAGFVSGSFPRDPLSPADAPPEPDPWNIPLGDSDDSAAPFWTGVAAVASALAELNGQLCQIEDGLPRRPLEDGVPQPAPRLKQVPPT